MQGNCSQAGSPPPEWTLLEPLPAGSAACAVQVEDSFIEVPIGHPQLWLNRLHVIAAQGRTNVNTTPANTDSNETSSLVVHVCRQPLGLLFCRTFCSRPIPPARCCH